MSDASGNVVSFDATAVYLGTFVHDDYYSPAITYLLCFLFVFLLQHVLYCTVLTNYDQMHLPRETR